MDLEKLQQKLEHRRPAILGSEHFLKYAILIPIVQKQDELHLLFEVRASTMRRQPGEVCFPGGRIEEGDKNEQEAAIRETAEELGISSNKITNVQPLDYFVSPFGMIIYPYVGFIEEAEILPNQEEVERVFTVPLSYLLHNPPKKFEMNYEVKPAADFPYHLIPGGENYNFRQRPLPEYFYEYNSDVIWGLTGRVLKHFIDVIQKD